VEETMRYLILVILVILVISILSGCQGDHPWRDEHRGILKDVRGFAGDLVVQFDDNRTFSFPVAYLRESDEWGIGKMVTLQTMRDSMFLGKGLFYRFISLADNERQHVPRERSVLQVHLPCVHEARRGEAVDAGEGVMMTCRDCEHHRGPFDSDDDCYCDVSEDEMHRLCCPTMAHYENVEPVDAEECPWFVLRP